MNHLDEQVEAMRAILESVGGQMWIPEDAPDEIKREFLKIIRECPDCRAILSKKGH